MKAIIIAVLTIGFIGSASAQIKCQPDGRGGMCCWDVGTQGPFKPLGC